MWGGECLRVNYRECEHLGGLPAVALPGGDLAGEAAVAKPAGAVPARFVPEWQNYSETSVQQQNWERAGRAIERVELTPLASSCGRLFDAVVAALAVRQPR